MSTISYPQTADALGRPVGTGDPSHAGLPDRRPFGLRLRVALHRGRLTADLAHGADPGSSPELAHRAAQLTSERRRKQLVRTLRAILAEANQPRLPRSQVVVVNRCAVLDAEYAINAMIVRLSYAEPVRAEGMAIAERIISNADQSPLYNPAEPGALRRLVRAVTDALETTPSVNRELSAAAQEEFHA